MSRESLTQLIIDEAQRKADLIIREARTVVDKIRHEESERLSAGKAQLESEFTKKKVILASSKSARINSMERATELKVIHRVLDRIKKQSADILLSDSKVRDKLREIASVWKGGTLSVGTRIAESLPEITSNATMKTDSDAPDYAMIFCSGGINEVIDLTYECGRTVDEDADEFVAILTSP